MKVDIVKAIADITMAICEEEVMESLTLLRNVGDFIATKSTEDNILNSPILQKVKRVSYRECADMFKFPNGEDIGVEYELIMTADVLQYLLESTPVDNDFINLAGQFWTYTIDDHLEDVVKEHYKQFGMCDLVMLPNNTLQEVPREYWYKIDILEENKKENK